MQFENKYYGSWNPTADIYTIDRLLASGDVGLDRWIVKEETDRSVQETVFFRFIALAMDDHQ
ncbi:hypothetical protein LCGC14_2557260 [marine sediment metagenome]|uniref:Uncharacterized protein n=1 Tax=marine sediment metagenome TaxID=412755 RepID=A0A0F9AL35_9ZZZZ